MGMSKGNQGPDITAEGPDHGVTIELRKCFEKSMALPDVLDAGACEC